MKKISLLVTAFILSFGLMANTIESSFQTSNSMAKGLQVVILESLQKELPCLVEETLQEQVTSYDVDNIDQGVRDVYYKTNFVAYARVNQSVLKVDILVNSVDYEIHNPRFQRYRVENIESSESCY